MIEIKLGTEGCGLDECFDGVLVYLHVPAVRADFPVLDFPFAKIVGWTVVWPLLISILLRVVAVHYWRCWRYGSFGDCMLDAFGLDITPWRGILLQRVVLVLWVVIDLKIKQDSYKCGCRVSCIHLVVWFPWLSLTTWPQHRCWNMAVPNNCR